MTAASDALLLGGVFDGLTSSEVALPRSTEGGPEVRRGWAGQMGEQIREAELSAGLHQNDLRFVRAGTALWLCCNIAPFFAEIGRHLSGRTSTSPLDPLELVTRIVDLLRAETSRNSTKERAASLAQLMIGSGIGLASNSLDWRNHLKHIALVQAGVPTECPATPLVRWAIEIEADQQELSLDERQSSLDRLLSGWDGVVGFDLNQWAHFLLSLELFRAATPLAKRAVEKAATIEYFPEAVRSLVSAEVQAYNVVACQDTYGWALCYEGRWNEALSILSSAAHAHALAGRSVAWCEVEYHRAHATFWLGRKEEANQIARAMCEACPTSIWSKRAATLFCSERKPKAKPQQEASYDIVISFAGEDRSYASQLARKLMERGITVFYDDFERAALWGKDLYEYLSDVYQNRGRYCVVLVSKEYREKRWTRVEWRAVQARCFLEDKEYCLPLRIDDTELPGLLPTTGYMSLKRNGIDGIVETIVEKLRSVDVAASLLSSRGQS
jgi:tetratricopeptide (TPR) repeat protein